MNNVNQLIKINNESMDKYNHTLDNEMKEILSYARNNHIPVLLEDTAKLLFSVVFNLQPKKMLEIGTAIGYSGTLLLNATKGSLTTIENFEDNYQLAIKHFESAGLKDRVIPIFDDAYNAIVQLSQNNEKFDFIFLDGPKGQYIKYLPILKSMLNDGGVLFADNVHFKGMVFWEGIIPHRKRTIVVNLRKYLEAVKTDKDFDSVELDVGDGVTVSQLIYKNK